MSCNSLFPNHCERESFSSMDDALGALQTRIQQLKRCLVVLDMLSEDERSIELRANALGQIQELERLQAKGLLIKTLDEGSPPVKGGDIAGMDAKIARCERMVSLLETSGGGSDKELRKIHKLIGELKTIRNQAAAQKAREAESDSGLPPLLMGFLHLLLAAQESENDAEKESDSSDSDSDSSDSDSDSDSD